MRSRQSWGWVGLSALWIAGATGCGTPGAPQPPSLNLPQTVTDLSANRAGDRVTLTWTCPKKNTDKLAIKGDIKARVCRREGSGTCADAGSLKELPGATGTFSETLPDALSSGTPRELHYFVEMRNKAGRSAGLSNPVAVLAGAPPVPVQGLSAEMRKEGVVLRWKADREDGGVRLQRTLLTPPATKPKEGIATPSGEPVEQNLWVEGGSGTGRTLDKNIRFGETYEYRAQRVLRVTVDGKSLELAGELSAAVRVEANDVFPPAVPTGLAAVASLGGNGGETAVDLSWQPDTEADVAGYVVYRREGGAAWQRISPAAPVVGPAFHDAHVEPGHTYRYAVSALDQGGHESARSEEAEESVPNQ
ncbi:MAG: hypothetical protein WBV28_07970 [Terracidiphilus sp.]